jgi:8-oxo-dGTP pyrophosphatase MutT (NUDIX family)
MRTATWTGDGAGATAMMDRLMTALRKRPRHKETVEDGLRWAAVALILRGATETDAELLFIRRAERVGDPWSGHVAFPGGRRDATDTSLDVTARRETLEELALDLNRDAQLLGVLDDLRPRSSALPTIAVRPFVFHITAPIVLRPNEEVHSAFWTPLAWLRDPASSIEHVFDRDGARLRFPAYGWGEHVVWGMTERFVTQLLAVSALDG